MEVVVVVVVVEVVVEVVVVVVVVVVAAAVVMVVVVVVDNILHLQHRAPVCCSFGTLERGSLYGCRGSKGGP